MAVANLSPKPNQRDYWCFISYRHLDNKEPGRQWATWLHQAIETYEVPSDLVGTINERGDTIPERIFPVFRDEEELPVDAILELPIYRALDASKFLVVICSPRAVESSYVDSEIRYFKQLGRGGRVLAIMIEGEPNASSDLGKQREGLASGMECFPKAILQRVTSEGVWINERSEPIAADFRIGTQQGWTSPEAYRIALRRHQVDSEIIEEKVAEYIKRSELMKLKVMAGILGVPLGILTERDKAYQLDIARRKARVLRRWLAAVVLLALLSIAGGVWAGILRQVAQRQTLHALKARADADDLNSFLLGDLREKLEETGRLDLLDDAASQSMKYLSALKTTELSPDEVQMSTLSRLKLAYNIATLRLGQGRLNEALQALEALKETMSTENSFSREALIARASLLNAKCDLLARTGSYEDGDKAGNEALVLIQSLSGDDINVLRATILINMADLERQIGNYTAAVTHIEESVFSCTKSIANAKARAALLRALLRQCDIARSRGDLLAAQHVAEYRLSLSEQYYNESPLAPQWQVERALSHDRLAEVFLEKEEIDKAREEVRKSLTIWNELVSHDPDNREWLRLQSTGYTKAGQIELAADHSQAAYDYFEKTLSIDRQLCAAAPQNLTWKAGLATALSLLGDAIFDLRQTSSSEDSENTSHVPPVDADPLKSYTEALEIRKELHREGAATLDVDNTEKLVISLIKMSDAESVFGHADEAKQLAKEAVGIASSLAGTTDALPLHKDLLASALETDGEQSIASGLPDAGKGSYENALKIRESIITKDPTNPVSLYKLAYCEIQLAGIHKDNAIYREGSTNPPVASSERAVAISFYEAAKAKLIRLTSQSSSTKSYSSLLDRCNRELEEAQGKRFN